MQMDRFRLQVEFSFMGHLLISNFAFILIQNESSSIVFYTEEASKWLWIYIFKIKKTL